MTSIPARVRRLAPRPEVCRLVRVVATLQSGAALPTWFPAPLDGILAMAARRRALGADYWAPVETPTRDELTSDPHGTRIPAVIAYRARDKHHDIGLRPKSFGGGPWVWAATCAAPDPAAVEDVRWWHKRFRARQAEQVVDRLPANTDVGVTKAVRMPTVVTITRTLSWRAIGAPATIEDLLGDVTALGKKVAQGEGLVLDWSVTDEGAPDWDRIWWGDDGHPARPLPHHARCLRQLEIDHADAVPAALRPPYWRPTQAHRGGGFERNWGEVIAPWTQRPRVSTPA